MVRPKCCFNIKYRPRVTTFGPCDSKDKGEHVELSLEEIESLRLKDVEGMEQVEAAEKMNISQSTFQRILACARKKTSTALIKGNTLHITSKK